MRTTLLPTLWLAILLLGCGSSQSTTAAEPPPAETRSEPAAESRPAETVTGRVVCGAVEDERGDGIFDPNIVRRMITARLRAIEGCYTPLLNDDPSRVGRVLVRLSIEMSGLVADVSAVENTTGSAEVAACVVGTIERFRFRPGAEGGSYVVAFPFEFSVADRSAHVR